MIAAVDKCWVWVIKLGIALTIYLAPLQKLARWKDMVAEVFWFTCSQQCVLRRGQWSFRNLTHYKKLDVRRQYRSAHVGDFFRCWMFESASLDVSKCERLDGKELLNLTWIFSGRFDIIIFRTGRTPFDGQNTCDQTQNWPHHSRTWRNEKSDDNICTVFFLGVINDSGYSLSKGWQL